MGSMQDQKLFIGSLLLAAYGRWKPWKQALDWNAGSFIACVPLTLKCFLNPCLIEY